jgi:hypothetical protein
MLWDALKCFKKFNFGDFKNKNEASKILTNNIEASLTQFIIQQFKFNIFNQLTATSKPQNNQIWAFFTS